MEIIKKPYEISIWEDKLVHGESGKPNDSYFDEVKIAIIGSDSMTAPWRAVNPSFVTNVNGSHTLTFTMYTKYYDDATDELADNPFTKLMVNERKVKLKYDGEWYDFIIKNIQENSEQHSYTYTAKDLAINELSKNGFALVLDEELNNNVGTVVELAEKILEGTDWQVSREKSETVRQLTEEPLYEVTLVKSLDIKNILTGITKTLQADDIIYVFYSCYVNNDDTSFFQILYKPEEEGEYEKDDDRLIIDSDKWNWVVTSDITYDGDHYDFEASAARVTDDYRGERLVRSVETFYDKVLDRYVTVYSKNKETGEPDVCGYSKPEYLVDSVVKNYVDNGRDFTATTGWRAETCSVQNINADLSLKTNPDIKDIKKVSDISEIDVVSYMNWTCDSANGSIEYKEEDKVIGTSRPKLLCMCVNSNRTAIHEFAVGEGTDVPPDKYIFLARIGSQMGSVYANKDFPFKISVSEYEIDYLTGTIRIKENYFDSTDTGTKKEDVKPYGNDKGYVQITMSCKKAASFKELLEKRIGLFLTPTGSFPENGFFIEDVQFFKETRENPKEDEEIGKLIYPITEDTPQNPEKPLLGAEVRYQYFYYHYNPEIEDEESINYIYKGYEEQNGFNALYNEDCEKKRSIKASESNRFNLLQELCETFECWIKFEVEHDPDTGKIAVEPLGTTTGEDEVQRTRYRQKKQVSFKNYVGRDNYAGFRYGINLKSINRTIDSEAIVSKLIVKPNSNQYAPGGFCTIATSSENESGEAFILDFSHYYTQGLLNINEVTNDLYVPALGIGYITRLKRLNKSVEDDIEEQTTLVGTTIPNLRAQSQLYSGYVTAAEEKIQEFLAKFSQTVGKAGAGSESLTIEGFLNDKTNSWWADEELVGLVQSIVFLQNNCAQYKKLSKTYDAQLKAAEARLKEIDTKLEDIVKQKEVINQEFYEKYARFIQEGSWISEDYVDDNLYYLDAESTLHTSSQPKVTYNISVVEVSELEGLEPYNFRVGDKTYIEDTEFFGYTYKESGDGTYKTPYHEEVVVTEVKFQLDAPEQNSITVQNYKTQFEDLFQRITATTTSVQFSTGDYQRAASAIEQDGTINVDVLQNSLFNNSIVLQNSNNNSVVWDESGITTVDLNSPNRIVRIVGGGIFLSTDYGSTWTTGITGSGINADCITAGQIDTSVIRLMDGANPTFRWDKNGITAYNIRYEIKEDKEVVTGYSQNNFVRFDQYGVYAIDGVVDKPEGQEAGDGGFRAARAVEVDGKSLRDEEKIAYFSRFYLTRKGFGLKTDEGAVTITNTDDIQVFEKLEDTSLQERVHIGRIGKDSQDKNVYGLQLRDSTGQITLENSSEGKLFLKDTISIGPNAYTPRVVLGASEFYYNESDEHEYGDKATRDDADFSKIFSVKDIAQNETIAFYDDGKLVATNVDITGTITATGGKIGNMTIGEVEQSVYKVVITSDVGQLVRPGEAFTLTASLYKGSTKIQEGLKYAWTSNNINAGTGESTFKVESAARNTVYDISCEITYTESGKELYSGTGFYTVAVVENGENGENGTDGRGIESIEVTYGVSSEENTQPEEWIEDLSTLQIGPGDFLWTKTHITYTDGSEPTDTYTKTRYGVDGQDGKPGEDGKPGKDGENGKDAPAVKAQYSETGEVDTWHDDFAANDKYVHFSYDDGLTWTEAIKIVGEDGEDANSYKIELSHQKFYKFYNANEQPILIVEKTAMTDTSKAYLYAEDSSEPTVWLYRLNGETNEYSWENTGNTKEEYLKSSISLSPNSITIQVYYNNENKPLSCDDYSITIEKVDNKIISNNQSGSEANEVSENSLIDKLSKEEIILYKSDNINNTYIFDLNKMLSCSFSEESNERVLQDNLLNDNTCFIVKIQVNGILVASTAIFLEFGTSDNMAQFALTATNIQMAINNTGLTFDAFGITVVNGGFRILRQNSDINNIISYDTIFSVENGSLYVNGNGTFTGTVNATDGEFTGTIHASNGEFNGTIISSSGKIGGFFIEADSLYSEKGVIDIFATTNEEFTKYNFGLETNGIFYKIDDSKETPDFSDSNFINFLLEKYQNNQIEIVSISVTSNIFGPYIAPIYGEEEENKEEIVSFKKVESAQESEITLVRIKNINIYDNSALRLDGVNGIIYAQNIKLGEGAELEKSLNLGERVFLWNSDHPDSNGTVLEVFEKEDDRVISKIKITKEGLINLGNIILDGSNSKIYGTNFTITPNLSTFNNVVVSGKIVTSVFEADHTQAVGGSMVFKTSYKVNSTERTTDDLDNNVLKVFLDDSFNGNENDYIYMIKTNGTLEGPFRVNTISEDNCITFNITDNFEQSNYTGLIDIGTNGSVITAINSELSTNSKIGLYPQGLSISEFKEDGDAELKAFLGNLEGLNMLGLNGYGLYSSNVYLTGSLTTVISGESEQSYAGINTLNGVINQVDDDEDNSEIVFWAGSEDTSPGSIQRSPFRVTRNGTLYANKGKFANGVISNTQIRSSDIYTARIHGTGENNDAGGLNFYDDNETKTGIVFFNGKYVKLPTEEATLPTEIFRITGEGFSVLTKDAQDNDISSSFIHISHLDGIAEVSFNGFDASINHLYTSDSSSWLHLTKTTIYNELYNGSNLTNEGQKISKLQFTEDKALLFNEFNDNNENEIIKFSSTLTNINSNTSTFLGHVIFGQKLSFKLEENSYNLYVEE